MAVILVADDEEAIRAFVSLVLHSAGHEVFTASNGAEAVAVFRSNADKIDLVITDISMPTMDGVQAILRIHQTRPDAQVICMTGDSADRCPGQVTLLQKPFSAEQLRLCVEQILGNRPVTSLHK